MIEFAYIHQETAYGQVLILKDYDALKEENTVTAKFHALGDGVIVDATIRTKNEDAAQSFFEALKEVDKVYLFIEEVLPKECLRHK